MQAQTSVARAAIRITAPLIARHRITAIITAVITIIIAVNITIVGDIIAVVTITTIAVITNIIREGRSLSSTIRTVGGL